MTSAARPSLTIGILLGTGLASVGCEQPVARYEVTVSVTDDCVIRSNGRFCDEPESLPSDVVTTVAVELVEPDNDRDIPHTFLYYENELFIAPGVEGERRVLKETRTFSGGCTVTVTEELRFNEDGTTFSGTLMRQTRTTGPESCGDTPFGTYREMNIVSTEEPAQ